MEEPLGGGTFADHTTERGVLLELRWSLIFNCVCPGVRQASSLFPSGCQQPSIIVSWQRYPRTTRRWYVLATMVCETRRHRPSAMPTVVATFRDAPMVVDRTIDHRPRAFIVVVLETHSLGAG